MSGDSLKGQGDSCESGVGDACLTGPLPRKAWHTKWVFRDMPKWRCPTHNLLVGHCGGNGVGVRGEVGADLGEELVEGGEEGGAVGEEVVDGGGEFDVVAEAAGEAREGERDAVESGVGVEPVVGEEDADAVAGALGDEGEVGAEGGVDGGDEVAAREGTEVMPIDGEAVIEEDVDKDGGVAAPARGQEVGAVFDEGMGIGEGVDAAMQGEAGVKGFGEGEAGAAFDPVGDEVADEGAVVGWGEEGVGEEVHGVSIPSE